MSDLKVSNEKEREIAIHGVCLGFIFGVFILFFLFNLLPSDVVSFLTNKALYDDYVAQKEQVERSEETCVSTKEMKVFCDHLKIEFQKKGYESSPRIESGYQCGVILPPKSIRFIGDNGEEVRFPTSGGLPIHLGGFKERIDSSAQVAAKEVVDFFDKKIKFIEN